MIHNNLRDFRVKYRLSQEKLAELCDISPRTIIRIEKGAVSPKFETMNKVAEVLGEDIYKIFPHDGLRIKKEELMRLFNKRFCPCIYISRADVVTFLEGLFK